MDWGCDVSARGKLSKEEVALAFLIGLGLLLMISAGAVGATLGDHANEALYGMLFVLGLLAFVAGAGLWLIFARPWEHFDDINVPKDSGHHGHDASH